MKEDFAVLYSIQVYHSGIIASILMTSNALGPIDCACT